VLTAVSDGQRAAFEEFAGELAVALEPRPEAVIDWLRACVQAR
jgi:hypothetical protein